MASTSAFEIGFAGSKTADVLADGAEAPDAVAGDCAEVPVAEPADGAGAGEPAAAVTLAACLEPKIADTMFPKTLIFFSSICSRSQTNFISGARWWIQSQLI
jgi:hypothetical protein